MLRLISKQFFITTKSYLGNLKINLTFRIYVNDIISIKINDEIIHKDMILNHIDELENITYIEYVDFSKHIQKIFLKNGEMHNELGPAKSSILQDLYYLNDVQYYKNEYFNIIRKKKLKHLL